MTNNIIPFPSNGKNNANKVNKESDKRKADFLKQAKTLQSQGHFEEAGEMYQLALAESYDKTTFAIYMDLLLHTGTSEQQNFVWKKYGPSFNDIADDDTLVTMYLLTQTQLELPIALANLSQLQKKIDPDDFYIYDLVQDAINECHISLALINSAERLESEKDFYNFIDNLRLDDYVDAMKNASTLTLNEYQNKMPLLMKIMADPYILQVAKAQIMHYLIEIEYNQPVKFSLFNRIYTLVPKQLKLQNDHYIDALTQDVEKFFNRRDPIFLGPFLEYMQHSYFVCFPLFEEIYPDAKVWLKLALKDHGYTTRFKGVKPTKNDIEFFEMLNESVIMALDAQTSDFMDDEWY